VRGGWQCEDEERRTRKAAVTEMIVGLRSPEESRWEGPGKKAIKQPRATCDHRRNRGGMRGSVDVDKRNKLGDGGQIGSACPGYAPTWHPPGRFHIWMAHSQNSKSAAAMTMPRVAISEMTTSRQRFEFRTSLHGRRQHNRKRHGRRRHNGYPQR